MRGQLNATGKTNDTHCEVNDVSYFLKKRNQAFTAEQANNTAAFCYEDWRNTGCHAAYEFFSAFKKYNELFNVGRRDMYFEKCLLAEIPERIPTNDLPSFYIKFNLVNSCQIISYYCLEIIKGRWPEFEHALTKLIIEDDSDSIINGHIVTYALSVMKERWPVLENEFVKSICSGKRTYEEIILKYLKGNIQSIKENPFVDIDLLVDYFKNPTMLLKFVNAYKIKLTESKELDMIRMLDQRLYTDASIFSHTTRLLDYARANDIGRWKEAESYFFKNSETKKLYLHYLKPICDEHEIMEILLLNE